MKKQYFWISEEHQFAVVYKWAPVLGVQSLHSYEVERGGVSKWLRMRLDQKGNYQQVEPPAALVQAARQAKVALPAIVWEQVI